MLPTGRRNFLKALIATAGTTAIAGCAGPQKMRQYPAIGLSRTEAQSVMDLIVPEMDTVRFGLIGLGRRGSNLLRLLYNVDGARITALCDARQDAVESAREISKQHGQSPAIYSGGDQAYLDLLERQDIDAVIIATPWRWHTPMALEAMSAGKQTFVEVPAAMSLEDCWRLVDASEQFQVNCMMMENVCYGRTEMMVLNMVRDGVLGTLLHGEAAYLHELRWQMKDLDEGTGSWRTDWHTRRLANLYPTHGLGPVSQYMDINRGDRFDYLTSMSSPAVGRQLYADREFAPDHRRRQATYVCGDMNTSLIRTVQGRTVLVQHDTTTPRPYSRHNLIQGTNGVFAGFPDRIAVEDSPFETDPNTYADFHRWDTDMGRWQARYEHAVWRQLLSKATDQGGHGGMDYVMLWRMVYCLRNGLPLDQNVYDAAAWSALTGLSEASVASRGAPQDCPDFTRGQWRDASPVTINL